MINFKKVFLNHKEYLSLDEKFKKYIIDTENVPAQLGTNSFGGFNIEFETFAIALEVKKKFNKRLF